MSTLRAGKILWLFIFVPLVAIGLSAASNDGPTPAMETALEGDIQDVQTPAWGNRIYAVTSNVDADPSTEDGRLYAVDSHTGAIVQQCDLPFNPLRATVVGDNYKAFVTAISGGDNDRGLIFVVDLSSNPCSVLKSLDYATPPTDADVDVDQFGQNPLGIDVNRVAGVDVLQAVVANFGPGRVQVRGAFVANYGAVKIDAGADAVIGGESRLSRFPTAVRTCTNADGPIAVVAHRTDQNNVTLINLRTGAKKVLTASSRPSDVAVDVACTTAYVINGGDVKISVIDLAQQEVVNTVDISKGLPVGNERMRITFNEAINRAYVYNPGFNSIFVHDFSDGTTTQVRTGVTKGGIGGIASTLDLGGPKWVVVGVNNPNQGNRLQFFHNLLGID